MFTTYIQFCILSYWRENTVDHKHECFIIVMKNLIFVVPCIMLNSEINPKMQQLRLFFTMALLYMFRVTIPPIIRSTYAVYGLRQVYLCCNFVSIMVVLSL